MGLFSKLMNELIDIIEWVDTTNNTIVWKFPRQDNEIKMGAKLIVRESQIAIFLNEGKIADVYSPGTYELTTQNMPLLTTLQGWKYGFHSPFKADVYFISTRMFTNQKWGTKNPVIIRDAEFGAIRLRAFGSFNFAIQDAKVFLTQISATNPDFNTEDISEQLRNIAVSRGMDEIASSKISLLDLTANYDVLSKLITDKIQPDFEEMGIGMRKFLIENISLPPEVEAVLDKRSEMGIIGNLGAYSQFQAANAIEESAKNSIGGNLGAAGMGLGVGAAMMGQVGNIFQQNPNNSFTPNPNEGASVPPPIPVIAEYFVAVGGKSEGPYSMEQLGQMAVSQNFHGNSMIWKKGMASWASASTVADIVEIFNSMPPPIPE